MYRTFADAEFLGGGTHRRLVLYDVKGKTFRSLLHISFQYETLPAFWWFSLCRGTAEYAAKVAAWFLRKKSRFFTKNNRKAKIWQLYFIVGSATILNVKVQAGQIYDGESPSCFAGQSMTAIWKGITSAQADLI